MQKRVESAERAFRSIGKRFLLRADFARFYPSIYTHSIPWARHGKDAARADSSLYGNRIDERVRESQDKQTVGIPIGPDTSYVIGEVVASSIDIAVAERIGKLYGTRFIDDYHLYFDSYDDAERGLAALHEVAASLELEVNDLKTEIVPIPEALEPDWKTELRSRTIDSASSDQPSQLIDLFSRAFALAQLHPHDNVLTFVAKRIVGFAIFDRHWALCEALLLRSAVAEPKVLRVLLEIYDGNPGFAPNTQKIAEAVKAICLEHGRLQHGNEVLWALWAAKRHSILVDDVAAAVISSIDDDLVALTALHLEAESLVDGLDTRLWRQSMSRNGLYSSHWLLAYEAHIKGWLRSGSGRDYVQADPFFKILQQHDVSFYDVAATEVEEELEYEDEDQDPTVDWEDDDDRDLDEAVSA